MARESQKIEKVFSSNVLVIWLQNLKLTASQSIRRMNKPEIQCSCTVLAWKSNFCQNCVAAIQMVIITLHQADRAAGHVVVVWVRYDSHISWSTSLITTAASVCRYNDMKWYINSLNVDDNLFCAGRYATCSYRQRRLISQTWHKEDPTRKDGKIHNAAGSRGKLLSYLSCFNT